MTTARVTAGQPAVGFWSCPLMLCVFWFVFQERTSVQLHVWMMVCASLTTHMACLSADVLMTSWEIHAKHVSLLYGGRGGGGGRVEVYWGGVCGVSFDNSYRLHGSNALMTSWEIHAKHASFYSKYNFMLVASDVNAHFPRRSFKICVQI